MKKTSKEIYITKKLDILFNDRITLNKFQKRFTEQVSFLDEKYNAEADNGKGLLGLFRSFDIQANSESLSMKHFFLGDLGLSLINAGVSLGSVKEILYRLQGDIQHIFSSNKELGISLLEGIENNYPREKDGSPILCEIMGGKTAHNGLQISSEAQRAIQDIDYTIKEGENTKLDYIFYLSLFENRDIYLVFDISNALTGVIHKSQIIEYLDKGFLMFGISKKIQQEFQGFHNKERNIHGERNLFIIKYVESIIQRIGKVDFGLLTKDQTIDQITFTVREADGKQFKFIEQTLPNYTGNYKSEGKGSKQARIYKSKISVDDLDKDGLL